MKQSGQDKGTLLLALIAGLSINGTFAALFSAIVPFSVFPVISLVLTVYCLHQRYQNRTMPVGLPGLAAACFILGVLLYSTVVRAEYPDIDVTTYMRRLIRILALISSRRCCR
ncbi:Putative inner membrane protein [Salmonella enterica subsp. enterica serovar Hvittingfoss str. A4-620]|nr:Putative inner membrane protein [Salmonella enterica subsp. enterica serovar Hvittingfoss str. A4-620]